MGTVSTTGLYTAPTATGAHNVTATSVAYPSDSVTARVTVVNGAQSAVLTFHNDDARDGAYLDEVTLTPSNVNPTQFGKVMSYPVDAQVYAQPLYLPQLNINGGVHDVVFIATQKNSLYAFDADASTGSGTTFWHVNFGQPVTTGDPGGPYPIAGILSTPVIDATSNTIYVVTHVEGGNPEYTLHALDVTTGKDRVTPAGISGTFQGDSLGSGCYQRMGLALDPVTNWVYAAIGSCPSGWIFAYDKTTLQQKAIFDATPGAGGGGFWSSGGAPAIDDSDGDLYLMNGTDNGDQQWIYPTSMNGYNDCFLRMDPNNLKVPLDYFAPDDNAWLATNDADLGSGGNILVPGSSTYPHEVLGGGKDGNVFVVNRDSMGGYNNQSNNVVQTVHIGTSQFDNIFSTPVYWNGWSTSTPTATCCGPSAGPPGRPGDSSFRPTPWRMVIPFSTSTARRHRCQQMATAMPSSGRLTTALTTPTIPVRADRRCCTRITPPTSRTNFTTVRMRAAETRQDWRLSLPCPPLPMDESLSQRVRSWISMAC